MPSITLDTSKLTKEQKARLAQGITELASEVMELPKEVFYVFFREYGLEEIGVGGKLLSERSAPPSGD